jgi:hypothetical protein
MASRLLDDLLYQQEAVASMRSFTDKVNDAHAKTKPLRAENTRKADEWREIVDDEVKKHTNWKTCAELARLIEPEVRRRCAEKGAWVPYTAAKPGEKAKAKRCLLDHLRSIEK